MIQAPNIDPVAFHLGPLSVRWYGLMYLLGFFLFAVLGRVHAKLPQYRSWTPKQIDDFLFYAIFGVILGGRLGEIIFYQPQLIWTNPIQIFKIWEGGMSFHGGLIGVLLVIWWFGRRTHRGFWEVADFVAPLIPLGLAAGRIGNFINGELYGRVTHVPWAMVFPNSDGLPRHPSQLYEFALEGLLLFCVLWWYSGKPRPRAAVSGLFLIGYGLCRSFVEFYRSPDWVWYLGGGIHITSGQALCVPMIIAGIIIMVWAYRRKTPPAEPAEIV